MKTIRSIYKIGMGPSSSHTMGPKRAAERFAARLAQPAVRVDVDFYGSLAATGRGHLADQAVAAGLASLGAAVRMEWHADRVLPRHPNGIRFSALGPDGCAFDTWQVYSIGGGELADDDGPVDPPAGSYPADSIADVLTWCRRAGRPIWSYVQEHEPPDLWDWLTTIRKAMDQSVERGLRADQPPLPGSLRLRRKAASAMHYAVRQRGWLHDLGMLSSYALAVAEENAAGGQVVTAPTCGSAGVLPAVLRYLQQHQHADPETLIRALATAGLFGSIAAQRASISGAEVGCQGEIGVACAMAAAAAAQIFGGSTEQIEYAAEMGLEHFLGLTCDPIGGLVQIPCIERNAFAAARAIDCAGYALACGGQHVVSFDDVVDVMKATGRDMQAKYRETARGGLAELMRKLLGDACPAS